MHRFNRADVLCLLMALIWGANMSIAKDALTEIPPLSFNAVRMPLASLLLLTLTRLTQGRFRFNRKDWGRLFLLGLVGNTGYQLFFILGLYYTRAGNVALLLATGIIWIALLSWALGHEKLTVHTCLGVALSLLGVCCILFESAEVAFGGWSLWGDFMILGGAVCWAVFTVLSRPLLHRYSSMAFTSHTLASGSVLLLLIGMPETLSVEWSSVSTRSYLELAYACIFAIAGAYAIWFYAVSRLGSTRTAMYGNLVPFFALLFAYLFLGDKVTVLQALGGGLILLGVYLTRRN